MEGRLRFLARWCSRVWRWLRLRWFGGRGGGGGVRRGTGGLFLRGLLFSLASQCVDFYTIWWSEMDCDQLLFHTIYIYGTWEEYV